MKCGWRKKLPFKRPTGKCATYLTLILTTVPVFASNIGLLGPLAAPGGIIFALEVLILLALLGGKLILLFNTIILSLCKVDLKLPPLLGMLVVGIMLKNIPYNIGQFGRSDDCISGTEINHTEVTTILPPYIEPIVSSSR